MTCCRRRWSGRADAGSGRGAGRAVLSARWPTAEPRPYLPSARRPNSDDVSVDGDVFRFESQCPVSWQQFVIGVAYACVSYFSEDSARTKAVIPSFFPSFLPSFLPFPHALSTYSLSDLGFALCGTVYPQALTTTAI